MNTFLQKSTVLLFVVFGLMALPLKAQEVEKESEEPFIRQGRFLTGFSLRLTDASRDYSDPQFGNGFTRLLIDLEGLYFISDHFGIGPLVGYEFQYREEADDVQDANNSIRDFKYGAKIGWYTSANELFNTSSLGRAQFFIDAGVSWLRSQMRMGDLEFDPDYHFGYQVGTGFLFPVGDQIAIETKLGFQARHQDQIIGIGLPEMKWLKEVTLGVGLKVTL